MVNRPPASVITMASPKLTSTLAMGRPLPSVTLPEATDSGIVVVVVGGVVVVVVELVVVVVDGRDVVEGVEKGRLAQPITTAARTNGARRLTQAG
jgi:hypothetical protein